MKILRIRKILFALAVSVATVATAHANLIVNGSFEDVTLPSQNWGLFSAINGWTLGSGSPDFEIGLGSVYGVTGYVGNNVMEMDSTGNVTVDQSVGTTGNYTLSLLYAQRSGVSPTSGSFEIWWNGSLVASLSPTSTAMTLYSTTVAGLASNTLELRGTGTQDQYGAIVDDVQLAAVPEPSTCVAGALLMLPFGVQIIRRLRTRN